MARPLLDFAVLTISSDELVISLAPKLFNLWYISVPYKIAKYNTIFDLFRLFTFFYGII